MKTFRLPWLALFLAFCLPAQALAAVLAECEQHVAESHESTYVQAELETSNFDTSNSDHDHLTATQTPDCHGTSANPQSDDASNSAGAEDSDSCFHCSGACQNFKTLSLIAGSQPNHLLDNSAFSRLNQATEAGIHTNPARPPCPLVLS